MDLSPTLNISGDRGCWVAVFFQLLMSGRSGLMMLGEMGAESLHDHVTWSAFVLLSVNCVFLMIAHCFTTSCVVLLLGGFDGRKTNK